MRQALLTSALLLPLALDTLALAAALGVAGLEQKDRLRISLVFTLFEAGMPIVGILAGRAVGNLVGEWAGWGGIAVLLAAGVLMLRPGKDEEAEAKRLRFLAHARGPAIVSIGLGISLDELSIGLSAGLLGLPVALAVIWIAVQAFLATQLGLRFGSRLGEKLRERSEQVAGTALILVGLLLLVARLLRI